jgi:catechol 2,3-dioxygenase-like lactoylglutathione lyase family enzyme
LKNFPQEEVNSVPPKRTKLPRTKKISAGLEFNHAMIYTRDAARAVDFYAGRLGFKLIDEYRHEGFLVYARLRAPRGNSTIALHMLEPGGTLPENEGVRLYFEVKNHESFCKSLEAAGVAFDPQPMLMPWGRHHAYLRDPDGHEISLYWAGPKRCRSTTMKR